MEAIEGIASTLEQINERLRQLECRVAALEGQTEEESNAAVHLKIVNFEVVPDPNAASERIATPAASTGAAGKMAPVPLTPTAPTGNSPRAETWQGFPSVGMQSGIVPGIGKAVLGISGAYLLRAVAESGTVAAWLVLVVAIAYAGLWMVWAARSHAHGFARVAYAITSALILSPMLLESTVRFATLSPAMAGVVLVGYVVLALALSWQLQLQLIPWVATATAIVTALALIVSTHAVVPLSVALLVMALAVEIGVFAGRRFTVRVLPAVAADIALLMLVYLMTMPEGLPESYQRASATTVALLCLAPLALSIGSIGIRSFWSRQRIGFFDVVQSTLSFAVVIFGAVLISLGWFAPALGVLFLSLGAACYWGALSRFADESDTVNRRLCAVWAAALLITGGVLLFAALFQTMFFCVAALIATYCYSRTANLSLALHASVFVVAAAIASGLPLYVFNAFAGKVPGSPGLGIWIVLFAAALSYRMESRTAEQLTGGRILLLVPVLIVATTGAALAVSALVPLFAGRLEFAASRLSVVRTAVNCVLALVLGMLGARWKRIELGWVAYAAVGFGTLKLVFEDLRFGNASSLVVSLLFYGFILILLPQLTRRSKIEA